jgi:hypothetical protein
LRQPELEGSRPFFRDVYTAEARRQARLKERRSKDDRAVSIGEIFTFLIARGHTLHDLKNVYTIRQINLFYKYAMSDDLHNTRLQTHGVFTAMQAVIGSAFGGKNVGTKSFQTYRDFLDSLDLNMLQAKKEKERRIASNPMGLLAMLGLKPVGKTGESSE